MVDEIVFKDFVSRVDTNGSGTMNFGEALSFFRELKNANVQELFKKAFPEFFPAA